MRPNRAASNRLFDFDGGSLKTYGRMVTQLDLQVGRVLKALDTNGHRERYHRYFHQRQRRRAVFGHVAVHGEEAGSTGRRTAHTGDRALAGSY